VRLTVTVRGGLRSPRFSLLLSCLLASCASFNAAIDDKTALTGPARGDLGRELEVHVAANDAVLASEFVDAVEADFESADLFDAVLATADTAPIRSGASSARLDLEVKGGESGDVHDFWRQRDGFVARYELGCRLTDRTGTVVLEGPVSGIAYDDVTDPDKLKEEKRQEIRAAARRDAALKIGRLLRRQAQAKANEALQAMERIHLPKGVGPVRIASLGFDDDPAARRRRGSQLTREVAAALEKLGPDLDVVSPEEVEQELGADSEGLLRSYEKIGPTELDRIIPRLGMRLIVVGKITADGNRVEATASVRPTATDSAPIGPAVQAAAEGPGALSLVAVELARQLGGELEKNPPKLLPKRDEPDSPDDLPKKKTDDEKPPK
jgi:hypothetical protein